MERLDLRGVKRRLQRVQLDTDVGQAVEIL
jgi:hypothetical protein